MSDVNVIQPQELYENLLRPLPKLEIREKKIGELWGIQFATREVVNPGLPTTSTLEKESKPRR